MSVDRLMRGDVYARTVAVPEGYNLYDIAAVVEQAGLGSAADFIAVAQHDVSLLRDIDPQATSLEGYLFPDTYQFTRIDTAHDIAAAMVHRFRQAAQKIGLLGRPDIGKIVTMASIVEKETAVAEESAAGGRRLLQPPRKEHAAGRRPNCDLRRAA